MIRIAVPATSANLGIGFDCLGIALDIYNYFEFEERDKWEFSGFEPQYENMDNLFVKAYLKAMDRIGKKAKPLYVGIKQNIPISRGLGSSAAMSIAGICAASMLNGASISKMDAIKLGTELEGHPDNAAPALLGNLSICSGDMIINRRISDKYFFQLWIPEYELRTEEARKVVPLTFERKEVVGNIGSALVGIDGLINGNDEQLIKLSEDNIHEPYRKKLIPDFETIKKYALRKGALAFMISGSGSTCISIHRYDFDTDDFPKTKVQWNTVKTRVSEKGAHICPTSL